MTTKEFIIEEVEVDDDLDDLFVGQESSYQDKLNDEEAAESYSTYSVVYEFHHDEEGLLPHRRH